MAAPKKEYNSFKEAEAYLHNEGLRLNPNNHRYEIDMRGDGGGTTWAEIYPTCEPGIYKIRHGHID